MTIQELKDTMYICTSPHSAAPSAHMTDAQWQSYALFINDTLSQLRSGETAYAWFTYQIQDLLRFEHDRLCTCYCPAERMWTLWLTNE